MYENNSEVKTLIELTEHFLEFLDLLYQQGNISATQFSQMTEKKIEFINKMRDNQIPLKA